MTGVCRTKIIAHSGNDIAGKLLEDQERAYQIKLSPALRERVPTPQQNVDDNRMSDYARRNTCAGVLGYEAGLEI